MSVNGGSTPSGLLQAAQQTSIGTQGHGMLPREWYPGRGLVLRSSLPGLPADACTKASNIRWNGVVWTTQNIGWKQQRAAAYGNGPIAEQAKHWNANGQQLYVHQAGTQVQTIDPTTAITGETTLFTAATRTVPCMRSFNPNYFIYVNGVDLPQYWDGIQSSFKPLPCFPFTNANSVYATPAICETFLNRVAFAGFQNNPFAVVIGNFGDPSTITILNINNTPTYGGIFYVPSQCGPVTWLKSLQTSLTSNGQALMVGCLNGFAFVTGTDATNFIMVVAQADKWGVPSNRAFFTIDTTLYVLCSDGIRPINGNAYQSNLINALISYPIHPLTSSWNSQSQASQAFCLDNPGELEATFYFSTGGDAINRTGVIFSYADLTDGLGPRFSQKIYPNGSTVSSGVQYSSACGIQFKGRYYGGGWDGLLQQHYTNNTWNGTGINYEIESPLFDSNTVVEEATVQRMAIMHQSAGTSVNLKYFSFTPLAAGSQGLVRRANTPQTITLPNTGTTGLGTTCALGDPNHLGLATFGGQQYQITPYNPAGGGRGGQINISGNTTNGDLNLVGVFAILIGGGTRQ